MFKQLVKENAMENTHTVDTQFSKYPVPLWFGLLAGLILLHLPNLLGVAVDWLMRHTVAAEGNLSYLTQVFVYALSPLLIVAAISQQNKTPLNKMISMLGLAIPVPIKPVLIGVSLGVLTTLLSTLLGHWLEAKPEQSSLLLLGQYQGWVGLVSLSFIVVLAAPIIEEIIFRGWLYPLATKTRLGSFGAALFISILFTALHFNPTVQSIALFSLFCVAMICCYLRYHFGNLWPSLAMHIAFNACQLTALAVQY
jgi:membrane protease YdiL (CAAX protease family)